MSQLEPMITKAWQQQAKWLWLLWPLSVLYAVVSHVRRRMYDKGLLKSYRAPKPILVIGNITVGGSGKTPLIIELVSYLQNQNVKVGVISRGYGGNIEAMPCLVKKDSLPQVVGDEPCLIVGQTDVPMSVCSNRKQAIECLLQAYPDIELIISDDGLQHYALQRDIEWIVVDADRGFGNKQLLPMGFLRESVRRLYNSTVIYHYANHTLNSEIVPSGVNGIAENTLTMTLEPKFIEPLLSQSNLVAQDETNQLPSQPLSQPLSQSMLASDFCHKYPKVYAVSGIGYPSRFFKTLRYIGFEVIERPFADHHFFSKQDLIAIYTNDANHDEKVNQQNNTPTISSMSTIPDIPTITIPIVVTSKDAVKLRQLAKQDSDIAKLPIWVLPVTAKLSSECYRLLDAQLKDLNATL